jgi:hypothetical protein
MLRWVLAEFPELAGRVTVVSRGGTHSWLSGLDVHYVDILELFPPEDFARHRELSEKQREVAEFEEIVVEEVKRHLGISSAGVMHPSLLYQSYFRFLKSNQLAYPMALRRRPDGVVDGLAATYAPIDVPDAPSELLDLLPDHFVAVRFYSSLPFPDTADTRRFASSVIDGLCRRTNVVVLNSPFRLDEHREVARDVQSDVTTIDHLMRPDNNLAIQTAVMARAKAFIGTYGGYSYLAPFLGVPSLSFSWNRSGAHSWHYELAQGIFDGPRWGSFVALRCADLKLIDLVTRDLMLDDVLDAA